MTGNSLTCSGWRVCLRSSASVLGSSITVQSLGSGGCFLTGICTSHQNKEMECLLNPDTNTCNNNIYIQGSRSLQKFVQILHFQVPYTFWPHYRVTICKVTEHRFSKLLTQYKIDMQTPCDLSHGSALIPALQVQSVKGGIWTTK